MRSNKRQKHKISSSYEESAKSDVIVHKEEEDLETDGSDEDESDQLSSKEEKDAAGIKRKGSFQVNTFLLQNIACINVYTYIFITSKSFSIQIKYCLFDFFLKQLQYYM